MGHLLQALQVMLVGSWLEQEGLFLMCSSTVSKTFSPIILLLCLPTISNTFWHFMQTLGFSIWDGTWFLQVEQRLLSDKNQQVNELNRQLNEANNRNNGLERGIREIEEKLNNRPNITNEQWNNTRQQLNNIQQEKNNLQSQLDDTRRERDNYKRELDDVIICDCGCKFCPYNEEEKAKREYEEMINKNTNNTRSTPPKRRKTYTPPRPHQPTNSNTPHQYNPDPNKEKEENNPNSPNPEEQPEVEGLLQTVIAAESLVKENKSDPEILSKLITERDNNTLLYQIINQEGRLDKVINELESIEKAGDKKIRKIKEGPKEEIIEELKGIKRTTGQHPGGLLITLPNTDIQRYTPLNYPADNRQSEWMTTHFEYSFLSEIFLKVDILGHDEPTVLQKLFQLTEVDPNKISFHDENIMKIFTTADTLGIPEFGTDFVRRNLLTPLKPNKFSQLVQISGFSHGTNLTAKEKGLLFTLKVILEMELKGLEKLAEKIIAYRQEKGKISSNWKEELTSLLNVNHIQQLENLAKIKDSEIQVDKKLEAIREHLKNPFQGKVRFREKTPEQISKERYDKDKVEVVKLEGTDYQEAVEAIFNHVKKNGEIIYPNFKAVRINDLENLKRLNSEKNLIPFPSVKKPKEKHTSTLIFLHGTYGAGSLDGMAEKIPGLKLMEADVPKAYNLYNISRQKNFEEADKIIHLDYCQLMRAVNCVNEIIEQEIRAGIPPKKIFISGYSQGGLLTLAVALTSQHKLGGFIPLCGLLPRWDKLLVNPSTKNKETPCLIINNSGDEWVPF
nr:12349_t:CDS:10 [Entrophospora candida]